jgi:hypothetical protein
MLKVYPRTLTRRDIPSVVVDETETTPNDVIHGNPDIAELSGKWAIDGTTLGADMMDKPFAKVFEELGLPANDVCYMTNVPDGKNA